MEDILKLKCINELKEVYRFAAVKDRKESTAEHSWSCLIVADYILSKLKQPVNKLRVYELLIYHDLVEIETGDDPLIPGNERKGKKEKEAEAAKVVKERLPKPLQDKFYDLFTEFEKQETKESKIAKIAEALDSDIHELDYKEDWKGWTEDYYLSNREHLFKDFPELKQLFKDFTKHLKDNGYLIVL